MQIFRTPADFIIFLLIVYFVKKTFDVSAVIIRILLILGISLLLYHYIMTSGWVIIQEILSHLIERTLSFVTGLIQMPDLL